MGQGRAGLAAWRSGLVGPALGMGGWLGLLWEWASACAQQTCLASAAPCRWATFKINAFFLSCFLSTLKHLQPRVLLCPCVFGVVQTLKPNPLQFVGASHMLVSCSHDGTARVWDAWSGDCAAVLEGHTGRLNAVVTSLDSSVIITCSDDNTARVWDGSTYKLTRCVGMAHGVPDAPGLCSVLNAGLPPARQS